MYKKHYNLLIKNTLWGSGSFILISIISFLILPYIVHKLSIEIYGIYILITSLVGFYGIFDLGFGNALIKYVAEYVEKNDLIKLNIYINSTVVSQGIIGFLISSIIIVFSSDIIFILNVSSENYFIAKKALDLCSFGFFLTFLGGAYRSVLQGMQLFKYTSLVDLILNLSINVFVAIILFLGYGLVGSIFINVFISLLTLIWYFILVKIKIPSYSLQIIINRKAVSDIFSFSFFIFLSKVSSLFSNYIVKFVISVFLGPIAVTYYTVPSKLVNAVGGIASNGLSAIFPFTSQLNVLNDDDEIKNLFLNSSKIFISAIIPVSLFISLFSFQIMEIWMGSEFATKTWLVLSIISFSSFIGGISAIPNLIVLGKGNSKLIGMFSLISIVLYSIFLPFLTKYFGITGTAIALLIATFGVIYYVLMKTTDFVSIEIKDFYIIVLKPHVRVIIITILALLTLQKLQFLNSYLLLSFGLVLILLHYFYLMNQKLIPINLIINKFR